MSSVPDLFTLFVISMGRGGGVPACGIASVLASWSPEPAGRAFMFLLPMYFVIGQADSSWQHYHALHRARSARCHCRPAGSGVRLALHVRLIAAASGGPRTRTVPPDAEGVLFVMLVSYAGSFCIRRWPRATSRLASTDFASWSLQLFYDIDRPLRLFSFAARGVFGSSRPLRAIAIATAYAVAGCDRGRPSTPNSIRRRRHRRLVRGDTSTCGHPTRRGRR